VTARGAWSGRSWCGQTTAFRVPETTLAAWAQRLSDASVKHATPSRCFGQPVLAFTDPDGVHRALVGIAGAERESIWSGGAIPKDEAIWGFHGVTLLLEAAAPTAAVLAGVPGFAESRA
jgi:glyoxalase family protein